MVALRTADFSSSRPVHDRRRIAAESVKPELPTSGTALDRSLNRACMRFAGDIGVLSQNVLLREGILRAAIPTLVKALELEFDGYQDVLSTELFVQGRLLDESYEH